MSDEEDTGAAPPEPSSEELQLRRRTEILRFVEAAIGQGVAPKRIAELASGRFSISVRQAYRYVRTALAKPEERPTEQVDAMLLRAAQVGMSSGRVAVAVSALDKFGKRRRPTKRSRKMLREFEKLGTPPLNDPLAGVEWMQKAILISAFDLATDPDVSAADKRDGLIRTGRTVAALVPQERLYDAEKRIRRDAAAVQDVREDPRTTTRASDPPRSLRVEAPRRRGG